METMMICRKCGIEQPISEYYLRKDGYRALACKGCYRAKTARWNQLHRTKARSDWWAANVKAKMVRIKDAVFGAYGGYRCACCGETERAFLSIDHIANDGAKWRREELGSRLATGWQTYRWLFKHGFPAGHQVLCMNCNFGKRMNGGICPHQTRRNDYPEMGVGSSEPKRTASVDSIH